MAHPSSLRRRIPVLVPSNAEASRRTKQVRSLPGARAAGSLRAPMKRIDDREYADVELADREEEEGEGQTPSELTDFNGAGGGGRTHTRGKPRRILSPVRLPIPPLQQGRELQFSIGDGRFRTGGKAILASLLDIAEFELSAGSCTPPRRTGRIRDEALLGPPEWVRRRRCGSGRDRPGWGRW